MQIDLKLKRGPQGCRERKVARGCHQRYPLCTTTPPSCVLRSSAAISNTGRVQFRLDMQFIKMVPSSGETDFVLVSQSNASRSSRTAQDLVALQMRGEEAVRNSGLGYTIIRPSVMLDVPQEVCTVLQCRCPSSSSSSAVYTEAEGTGLICAAPFGERTSAPVFAVRQRQQTGFGTV